jgi:solute carrier family 35 protein E3
LTNQNVFAFNYTSQVVVSGEEALADLFWCCFTLILILCLFNVQFFIVLSCLISVSVNFSTFLVIGKTSPVTYQVLGHLKTCLVLTFGYVLLHDPFSWRNILGILIAVVGMVLYSYFCSKEPKNTEVSPQQVLSYLSPMACKYFNIWFAVIIYNIYVLYIRSCDSLASWITFLFIIPHLDSVS